MITKPRGFLAVLATIAALAGCARQSAAEDSAVPAIDAARATYDEITAKVYGTPEQRRAYAEAGWLRPQLAIASCMAKAGQRYVPGPPQLLPDTGIAPGDLLAFSDERQDFGVGRGIQAFAAAGDITQPALVGATADQEARYSQAIGGCATGVVIGAGNLENRDVLDGRLIEVLTRVQSSATPTLTYAYPICLAAHGVQARNLSELYVKVSKAYPAISYDKRSDATKVDGWARAVAFEKKAAAADWACRADAVDIALVAAKPILERFAHDNAADLDAVAAGWAQATTDVAALRAKVKQAVED